MTDAPKPAREIRVRWRADGTPDVDDLTGADAKRALAGVMVEHRRLLAVLDAHEKRREALSQTLIALVHRDAVRGVLGPDGAPVLPMSTWVPADSLAAGRERWRYALRETLEGALEIVVDREPPPAETAPRVTL